MHIIFSIKNWIEDFVAETIARYDLYVSRENKKLQLQRAAYEQELAMQAMQTDYDCTGDILRESIIATAAVTNLIPAQTRHQLVSSNWLVKSSRGFYGFYYRSLRNPSDITAKDVQRILQREITHLCNYYGYPQKILRVRYQSDCRVEILVVNAADFRKPVKI